MSKPPEQPREQPPEPEWLCICIRRKPGTYEEAGGWVLRIGRIPEGRVPTDRSFEPNVLGVILGHIQAAIVHYRDNA